MLLLDERESVVDYCKKLISSELTTGTGGNISIYNREERLIAISPSGIEYDEMELEDVVVVDIEGNVVEGGKKPSSELGLHLELYKNNETVNAAVHTHSKYATAISTLRISLPVVHYLACLGGKEVRCAPYASFGTEELAQHTVKTIGQDRAVFMANHGLIALGENIKQAFGVAEQIEFVSEVYSIACAMGKPVELTEYEIDESLEKFKVYGQNR